MESGILAVTGGLAGVLVGWLGVRGILVLAPAALPAAAREVLWWNPLIHLVGLMRAGFYPVYDDSHVSVLYVLALGLGLVATGLVLMLACANRLVEQ